MGSVIIVAVMGYRAATMDEYVPIASQTLPQYVEVNVIVFLNGCSFPYGSAESLSGSGSDIISRYFSQKPCAIL
ncbi:MAG: hypothetical protein Q8R70_06700 [Methanoregula sp.]|nr:hypothetical protein [Methanoregula sp.]